jgi:Fuc2NAc and GlcNAc transferase
MDGIDGIAASETIFVAIAAALFLAKVGAFDWALLLLIVAAASAAFLTYNWEPATVFMGDVGSAFLGFTLASIAHLSVKEGYLSLAIWLILGGTFLIDATYTLAVRVISKQRWLQPHKLHVYQKLSRSIGSHSKTTSYYILVNVFWLFPLAWAAIERPVWEWWFAVAALTPLVVCAIRIRGGVPDDLTT